VAQMVSEPFASLGIGTPQRAGTTAIGTGAGFAAAAAPPAPMMVADSSTSNSFTRNNQSASITIEHLEVTAPKGEDPRSFAQAIRDELVNVLEGTAIGMGAPA
jgi:hypothetical protein